MRHVKWQMLVAWIVGIVSALSPLLSTAHAQNASATPVLYSLTDQSTYQTGCFPPCECLLMEELPIRGIFKLTPISHAVVDDVGWFDTYSVTDVDWTVVQGTSTIRISGKGTYRIGGESAMMHQLQLDLVIDGNEAEHFDSGLVPVPEGAGLPRINITISIHGMYCLDTVIKVDALPKVNMLPLPRHARFVLHPGQSSVEFSLFAGGTRSKLLGALRLFLGDPDVPVIDLAGMVGLSVDGAELVAPDLEPDSPALPEPLLMIQDPRVRSIGAWNTLTGEISFELHLTTPDGPLPVPQPLSLSGTLTNAGLKVEGNNGNVPDGSMQVTILAFEVPMPPPPIDVWFSTEIGFHASSIWPPVDATVAVSDGDLLSRRGHIIRTNFELTKHLGIMPAVPDLGLDAVALGPRREIWFSFEETIPQIWSETLGTWLKHGDLLSDAGRVVRTNEQLLAKFVRMPPVTDIGLDVTALAPNREILFSTEESFFSESLGQWVGHGDLISTRGRIVRTNAQMLANFHIWDETMGPVPMDYGLDAVVLRPNGEIWFSTELGFHVQNSDGNLQSISDGDLLSTNGHVVIKNLDLLAAFGPIEDVDNFGLDAITLVAPRLIADLNFDGHVDKNDYDRFRLAVSGPSVPSADMDIGDFDGDGDVDQSDFGLFQRCLGGTDIPADPECAD